MSTIKILKKNLILIYLSRWPVAHALHPMTYDFVVSSKLESLVGMGKREALLLLCGCSNLGIALCAAPVLPSLLSRCVGSL
jgi:hypothetical protein